MKIDIISGFLGAGKTTFIKHLLSTKIQNEKVVLIENEFGEISVDGDFLRETKLNIKELSQGCICCSLVGDFSKALKEMIEKYHPDRIIIEPSGVGKLSDVEQAIIDADLFQKLNAIVCLVDVTKAKMYAKNFGEFFIDQIQSANTVVLSRTDVAREDKISEAINVIRKYNESCVLVTTPIHQLTEEQILEAYEGVQEDFFHSVLEETKKSCEHHHHEEECGCEHHHHEEAYGCEHHHHEEACGCEHHHHEEACGCEYHHHEEACGCEHHHHEEACGCEHHHHEEACGCEHHYHEEACGCEHHHHEEECGCGHHHAEEVFISVGIETAKKYSLTYLQDILKQLSEGVFGMVIRAKGIVSTTENQWYQFNLTPNEVEIRETSQIVIGKICVIGSQINIEKIKKLF